MWICDACQTTARGLGARDAQLQLEGHLTDTGHSTGLYTYGGPQADDIVVFVERIAKGFEHKVITL